MSKKQRQTQARRYVIIQQAEEDAVKVVTRPVSIEVPENNTAPDVKSSKVYQDILAGSAEEAKAFNKAEIDQDQNPSLGRERLTALDVNFAGISREGGDLSVTAQGEVDDTYVLAPYKTSTNSYPPFIEQEKKNVRTYGDGLITESGSGEASRYTFRKGGQTQWQFRATPNYFAKVNSCLAQELGTANLGKSYLRPALIALENGNLLAAYIDGVSPHVNWFTHAKRSGEVGGDDSYGGPGPANTSKTGIVKMHLLDKETRKWSQSPEYEIYAPVSPDAGKAYGNDFAAPDPVYQVTCHDFVEFSDTGEVLYLYAGFLGSILSNSTFANGFFVVDTIRSNLDSGSAFVLGNTNDDYDHLDKKTVATTNRSFNQFKQGPTVNTNRPGDISGVTISTIIYDLTAQVLPSGRIVCVMATQTQLISCISDDRGKTWRGSRVMDLTFGDLDITGVTLETTTQRQRYATVSSCLDRNGKMVVLLTGNPTGDRRKHEPWSEHGVGIDTLTVPEPVISLFVTGDGEAYGAEKRLASGQFTQGFNDGVGIPNNSTNGNYTMWQNVNQLDEAVYPISGSVCLTPTGYIHVQIVSIKLGSLCGSHVQWVLTRTLSTKDIASMASDQEVARSIPDQIQKLTSPLHSRTHRFVPALIQYATYPALRWNSAQSTSPLPPHIWPHAIQIWSKFGALPFNLEYVNDMFGAVGAFNQPIQPQLCEFSTNGWLAQPELHRLGNLMGDRPGDATINTGGGDDVTKFPTHILGGGPIWVNGPIDIEAVLWRGEIVSTVCYRYEDKPVSFPGLHELMQIKNGTDNPFGTAGLNDALVVPNQLQAFERSVLVLHSGHFQPANVRIPNQIAIAAPLLQTGRRVAGPLPADAYKPDISISDGTGYLVNTNSSVGFGQRTPAALTTLGNVSQNISGIGRFCDRKHNSYTSGSNNDPAEGPAFGNDAGDTSSPAGINVDYTDSRRPFLGNEFGGNIWQISWFAGVNPINQGWQYYRGFTPPAAAGQKNLYLTGSRSQADVNYEDHDFNYTEMYIGGAQRTQTIHKNDPAADQDAQHYSFPDAYPGYVNPINRGNADQFQAKHIFPGSRGLLLKTSDDSEATDESSPPGNATMAGVSITKDNNPSKYYLDSQKKTWTFLSRLLVCVNKAGVAASYQEIGPNKYYEEPLCGASVLLIDEVAGEHLKMAVHIFNEPGDDFKRQLMLTVGGVQVTNSTVTLTIPDTNTETVGSDNGPGYRAGWIEVIWGVEDVEIGTIPEKGSAIRPFLMARIWDDGADKEWLNDFVIAGSGASTVTGKPATLPALAVGTGTTYTPYFETNEPTETSESFKFGCISASDGAFRDSDAYWKAAQLSRGHLVAEPCMATVSEGDASDFPIGESPYTKGRTIQESLHSNDDPAMGMFQVNDAGCMSPMRPSQTADFPSQMIHDGVELSFRGRATTPKLFEYSAASRFPAENIFKLPVSRGWRGSDTMLRGYGHSGTSDVKYDGFPHSPETIIDFDMGEKGVYPNAISMFGVNSPAVAIQFTNDVDSNGKPEFKSYLGGDNTAPSFLIAPPCDGYIKMGVYCERGISQNTNYFAITGGMQTGRAQCMFINRYLYYAQVASPAGQSGQYQALDRGQNQFRILQTGTVSFMPAGPNYGGNSTDYTNVGPETIRRAPFTPNQFKSVNGQSFYLVMYSMTNASPNYQSWIGIGPGGDVVKSNGSVEAVGTGLFKDAQGGAFRYVFKIEDNGADWVRTTNPEAVAQLETGSSSVSSNREISAVAIISDRIAFNLPDDNVASDELVGKTGPTPGRWSYSQSFRYMRIRVAGCEYYDPNEKYHKIDHMILGQRIDLSNRDFEWGWGASLATGSQLTTFQSGGRRSIRNHRPRQGWTITYSPKPEKRVTNQSMFNNPFEWDNAGNVNRFGVTADGAMNIETEIAGYGVTHAFDGGLLEDAFPKPSASSQFSFRSLTTWQELVDRVLTMGINGEVFTLGFDAYDMTFFGSFRPLRLMKSWSLYPPTILKSHSCLTDPKKLVIARCVGYGDAKHVGYQGVLRTNDLYGGNIDGSDGGPSWETSSIIQVGSIKFSEEV